jgi:hypothetical protein
LEKGREGIEEGVRWGKKGRDRGLLAKPPSPSSHRFRTERGGSGRPAGPAPAIVGAPGVDGSREQGEKEEGDGGFPLRGSPRLGTA